MTSRCSSSRWSCLQSPYTPDSDIARRGAGRGVRAAVLLFILKTHLPQQHRSVPKRGDLWSVKRCVYNPLKINRHHAHPLVVGLRANCQAGRRPRRGSSCTHSEFDLNCKGHSHNAWVVDGDATARSCRARCSLKSLHHLGW